MSKFAKIEWLALIVAFIGLAGVAFVILIEPAYLSSLAQSIYPVFWK